jgi:D-inositol-3-phosphate glycosyltransferase
MVTVHTSPLTDLGSPDAGGLTVYVLALSEQLIKRGIEVDIFTRRFDTETPDIVEYSPGINVISIKAGPPERLPKDGLYCLLPDFTSEMALFALESGRRYDIVHTHYWLSGWVGRLLKRYWQVPIVHMYHTLGHLKNSVSTNGPTESALRLQVERELIGALDCIVAPNPDERAELVWSLGARDCRVCTLPPGIDLQRFQPMEAGAARKRFGLPDGPIVLFVGRIDPIKDVGTLLDALAILRMRQGDEAPHLAIVGGELDAAGKPVGALEQVQARAAELCVKDRLILLGSRPQAELPALYSAATVCAVSSLYESFGLVAVESMACGTPVVATRVGGMRFTVEEDISGILVSPSDPDEMATGIARLVSDRHLHASFQVGARQAAIRFSWHTIGAEMTQLYERLATSERYEHPSIEKFYAS